MKTCMFQYYNSEFGGIIEDTKLISRKRLVQEALRSSNPRKLKLGKSSPYIADTGNS